jgi:hypothetical protein
MDVRRIIEGLRPSHTEVGTQQLFKAELGRPEKRPVLEGA